MSHFAQEWTVLQNQYDSYEKYSLLIKLVSVTLLALAVINHMLSTASVVLVFILWLQDAIWKTYQARIEVRLMSLEAALLPSDHTRRGAESNRDVEQHEQAQVHAFQYNTTFAQNRPSTLGLVKEYAKQAVRPTMVFPHAALAAVALMCFVIG